MAQKNARGQCTFAMLASRSGDGTGRSPGEETAVTFHHLIRYI